MSKTGKGTLEQQVKRLKGEMSPEDIAQAEKMVADPRLWNIAALAFKLKNRPYRQPKALTKGQRITYFQLIAQTNQQTADNWRKARLAEKGLDPKVVGPESAPSPEEKAKIEGKSKKDVVAPVAAK